MRRSISLLFALALLACASSTPPAPALISDVDVPFELTQNHIFVPISASNRPFTFLLDTGAAGTVLSQTTADSLNLARHGKTKARGAGPGEVEVPLVDDIHLDLAGLKLDMVHAPALPLDNLSLLEGRAIEGIIGYNLLTRYAIDVDYENKQLHFHDASRYAPPADAVALPITFNQNHPVTQARLTLPNGEVVPVHMMVDTGARNAILINRPFAEAHRVYEQVTPGLEGAFGFGVGGTTKQRVGRIRQYEMGGFKFDAPVVSVSRDSGGAGASSEVDGLIGGELLRRFTLTIDYPHRRLLLRPNAHFNDPLEFDMSGMFFKASDMQFKRILVRYILEGSPAAEAGIQVGDEIVTIDGAPPASIEALRMQLRKPDQTHELKILRGGREMNISLVTRRLV